MAKKRMLRRKPQSTSVGESPSDAKPQWVASQACVFYRSEEKQRCWKYTTDDQTGGNPLVGRDVYIRKALFPAGMPDQVLVVVSVQPPTGE